MASQKLDRDIAKWVRKVQNATSQMGHKKVLRKGARIAQKEMKAQIAAGANKLGRGKRDYVDRYYEGHFRARYYQGNLRRSVGTFTFRKSPAVFVGPRFNKGKSPYSASNRSVDGWYAHFINNGSANHTGIHFLEKTTNKTRARVKAACIKEAKKLLIYGKRRNRLG